VGVDKTDVMLDRAEGLRVEIVDDDAGKLRG
jgi:hypothetical protein